MSELFRIRSHIPAGADWYLLTPMVAEAGMPVSAIFHQPIIAWLVESMSFANAPHDVCQSMVTPITIDGEADQPFAICDPSGQISVPGDCTLFDEKDACRYFTEITAHHEKTRS